MGSVGGVREEIGADTRVGDLLDDFLDFIRLRKEVSNIGGGNVANLIEEFGGVFGSRVVGGELGVPPLVKDMCDFITVGGVLGKDILALLKVSLNSC